MNETLENRRQQEITSLAFDTKPKKKKKEFESCCRHYYCVILLHHLKKNLKSKEIRNSKMGFGLPHTEIP